MTKDTGGPAFPFDELNQQTGCVAVQHAGMTLRDYFAAKAMQSIIDSTQYQCGGGLSELENLQGLAKDSYAVADAMLKARQR